MYRLTLCAFRGIRSPFHRKFENIMKYRFTLCALHLTLLLFLHNFLLLLVLMINFPGFFNQLDVFSL